MKIYFIGTGSAVATSQRDNTSIYIHTDEWNLLVDCPGSLIYKFSILNIDFTKLQSVFITHPHTDHLYGLPSLIHSLEPFMIKPRIFIPEEFQNTVTALLGVFNLQKKADIVPVKNFFDNNNPVDIFSTRHTPGSKGIRIYFKNKTIIYTSDTGPILSADKIFSNADYLIHDCYAPSRFKSKIPALDDTHTSSLTLGKIAARAGVKNLIPIHFSGEHSFDINEIKAELKKSFNGNIIFPEDFFILEI